MVGLGAGFGLADGPPVARAVVGGSAGGPLEASAVMVLSDNGGVCTGVVTAPDVILTAAHCVPAGRSVRVHYREAGQPVLLEPAEIVRHPEFRANAAAERVRSIDLALIRLTSPLPGRFAPAFLSGAMPRERTVVAGYGVSREGDAGAMGVWRSAALSVTRPYGDSRVLLWAQGAPGVGGCQGDSGGPMLGEDGAVAAITSWTTGRPPARCGVLTQGVLLGPQRGWIDRVSGRWARAPEWR